MRLHMHFQGVGICIILFALSTIMISFLEVFALDVISELLSVVISFVAQFAFEIFSRKSLQNVLKPGFLVCLAHIWDTNLLT